MGTQAEASKWAGWKAIEAEEKKLKTALERADDPKNASTKAALIREANQAAEKLARFRGIAAEFERAGRTPDTMPAGWQLPE
jgi:hypothetical protein